MSLTAELVCFFPVIINQIVRELVKKTQNTIRFIDHQHMILETKASLQLLKVARLCQNSWVSV